MDFTGADIEEIGKLVITGTTPQGDAADFSLCRALKTAAGTFHGFVDFADSGITSVGQLKIILPENATTPKANFGSRDLRLPKSMLGPEYEMGDNIRRKNLLRFAVADAHPPDLEI